MNFFHPPRYWLINITTFLLERWFLNQITLNGVMPLNKETQPHLYIYIYTMKEK